MAFRPSTPLVDLTRLKAALLTSGVQQTNPALFQVINLLIDAIQSSFGTLESSIGTSTSGGGGTTNQTIQQFLIGLGDDDGGGGGDTIPGPKGEAGENGMVPYYIAPSEIFTIPIYKQALFSTNIDNEGILVIDGFLIEVD